MAGVQVGLSPVPRLFWGFNAAPTICDVIKGIDPSGTIAILTGGDTGIVFRNYQNTGNRGGNHSTCSIKKAERNLAGIIARQPG